MITADDFLKLVALEEQGHWIYCGGSEVHGLRYDTEMDAEKDEFLLPEGCTDARELCCTFVFADDRYTTVQSLNDYKKSEWTVMKPIWVDWRNHEG